MKIEELYVVEYGRIDGIDEDKNLDYYCTNSVSFINTQKFINFLHDLVIDLTFNYVGDDGNYIEVYKTENVELDDEDINNIVQNMCLDDDSDYKENLIQQIIFNNNLGGQL